MTSLAIVFAAPAFAQSTPSASASPATPPPAAAAAPAPAAVPAEESWLARQWRTLSAYVLGGDERGRVATPGAGPPGQKGGPPPAVTVSRPLARELIDWDEYVGRFEAVDLVDIRARVAGYLTEVHFKDGQIVTKGDRLYTIDARPFERSLETAKAELVQAQTRVQNAQKDVERGRPLVERQVISGKVFDDRENVVREGQAAVVVAEAKVKSAELELSFTAIAAPITGRIGRSAITEGNYIQGGGSNTATLLTTIVSQDPVYIYFDIGENNALKYRRLAQSGGATGGAAVGTEVQLALPDEKGFPHRGRLDFSDNRLDPATGTLRARAVVENASGLFSPGMFARVRLAGSPLYGALLIPDDAIGTDQASKFVAVVADDGTVQRRAVALGGLVDGLRVVRSGVAAEDWVVVKGIQRARPGSKVTAKREPIKVSATGGRVE